jgi:hypothetical protein
MADDDIPTPGRTEFSAEEEKQMREERRTGLGSVSGLPLLTLQLENKKASESIPPVPQRKPK